MGVWERRLYRVLNAVMRVLLRSPLHRLRSSRVLLLEFTGRRSGRSYCLPVSYWQPDADHVVCLTSAEWSVWWRNLDGAELAVWLRGRRRAGRSELVHDPIRRRELVSSFLRHNTQDLKHYGVARGPSGEPDVASCAALADAAATKVIDITLSPGPSGP
jgi:hypothetical protein